jgi:aminoglycoside phosphotransferase
MRGSSGSRVGCACRDELPGVPLADAIELPIETRIAILANALRTVHALDAPECPFDARVATRLAEAGERVRAERVVETDFDPELVADGAFAAMVDVGRLGVADRFTDLALAARDVAEDSGRAGSMHLRGAKLHFFQLLDELF